jgi:hypothetical protein
MRNEIYEEPSLFGLICFLNNSDRWLRIYQEFYGLLRFLRIFSINFKVLRSQLSYRKPKKTMESQARNLSNKSLNGFSEP